MNKKLRKGVYNVRIVSDNNGKITIGFFLKLYKKGGGRKWEDAPESTKKQLERIFK